MIDSAIDFAFKAHRGQVRKGTNIPYIVHPLETAKIVASIRADERLISAALLHDTIEDCETVTDEILRAEFGEEIAALVAAESEDKSKTWEERKSFTIARLKQAKEEEKIIALGDKLSNLRDIYNDYKLIGEKVWYKFRVPDKSKIGWYYKGLRASLDSLDYTEPWQEYNQLVDEVFPEI